MVNLLIAPSVLNCAASTYLLKMELHLHLSVAFRALDRKWGTPIDLDTSEDFSPCVPAVVDRPTTTFSSEEYFVSRRRQKPYSRQEKNRRKKNVEMNDSFGDINK